MSEFGVGLGRGLKLALALLCVFALAEFALIGPTAAQANEKYASIVVDAHDGSVLFSRNADSFRYPASLTKMMTLYVVFDRLDAGTLKTTDKITVSATASSQPPSKLGLKPGDTITVEQAILALVTKSANDVACAIAEQIAGSERAFAREMTETAKSIGMTRTTFRNASGLPDPSQRTTARDMAVLGRALMHDHAARYAYFSTKSFAWKGANYRNHNHLLGDYNGTTGIKTGYTRASGFNLTASVERNGYNLVAVVLGGKTSRSRDDHMKQLLDQQFARLRRSPGLANQGPLIAAIPGPRARPDSVLAAASPTEEITVAGLLPEPALGDVGELDANDPIAQAIALLSDKPTPAAGASHAVQTASLAAPFFTGEGDIDDGEARVLEWLGGDRQWGIQIGAFAAMESAAARLSAASALAPDHLDGATPAILPAPSGKSTLYRARFGPFDAAKAQAACAALNVRGIQCVPVQDAQTPKG